MVEVLDPRGAVSLSNHGGLSPRLDTLAGKRVVAIWNGRRPGPGREVLAGVLAWLDKRYGLADHRVIQKPYVGNEAPRAILSEVISSSDAALTGVGD